MEEAYVLDLTEEKNRNRWIIGTPPVVDKLEFYSEQIQIKYNQKTDKEFINDEDYHKHPFPIKEYYLVLKGVLTVKVENSEFKVNPMNILVVHPFKCHKVIDCSLPLEYFTIRSPPSDETKKISCRS